MTTKVQINAVRQVLDRSCEYDPASMTISMTGEVFAKKDPDKIPSSDRSIFKGRYLVGHVSDMVTKTGEIREGY